MRIKKGFLFYDIIISLAIVSIIIVSVYTMNTYSLKAHYDVGKDKEAANFAQNVMEERLAMDIVSIKSKALNEYNSEEDYKYTSLYPDMQHEVIVTPITLPDGGMDGNCKKIVVKVYYYGQNKKEGAKKCVELISYKSSRVEKDI